VAPGENPPQRHDFRTRDKETHEKRRNTRETNNCQLLNLSGIGALMPPQKMFQDDASPRRIHAKRQVAFNISMTLKRFSTH
jgi:hypothetical protein